MTGNDPAMSTVKKEELKDVELPPEWRSTGSEFLAEVKLEKDAPPLVTGSIKLEAITHESIDCEAPFCDLRKETCQVVNQGIKEAKEEDEGDHDDGLPPPWESAGVGDGGMANELGGVSGIECEMEGEVVKEDPSEVSSRRNEEEKHASSSEVTGMEHTEKEIPAAAKDEENAAAVVLREVTRLEGVLEVDHLLTAAEGEDGGPPPGWEATVINNEGEPLHPASVDSNPLEISMKEMQPTKDKLAAPDVRNNYDDDGPPPGWEPTVITHGGESEPPALVESMPLEIKMEEMRPMNDMLAAPDVVNNYDDDGPPPGWEPTVITDGGESKPPALVESIPLGIKMEEMQPTNDKLAAPNMENDYDDDGPPPGWEQIVITDGGDSEPPALVESIPLEIKMEEMQPANDKLAAPDMENDYDDDKPPPGWEPTDINDGGESEPLALVDSIPLVIKMEELQPTNVKLAALDSKNEYDGDGSPPAPGLETAAMKGTGAEEALLKLENGKEKEQEQLPTQPPLPRKAPSPPTEMGQVVCGSCRSLLSYAKGAKYVQCVCCQSVSFVLEAHQVGQVYCGNCSILLMYRYGSPAVKCSSCKFITQITPHNRRPPLSEQGVTLQSQLAQLRPTNIAQ